MAKSFIYSSADRSRIGLMVCDACHKPIEVGEFRYRDAREKCVLHHRSCSEEDDNWARIDKQNDDARRELNEFVRACKAFKEKWNVNDLDYYIENMKET